MKTALLIAIGSTLLFGVGLIHSERQPNPDDRPNLANSNVAAASARQQIRPPNFVAVATTFPAMLLGLLVSTAGLIVLVGELIRRAPEGYEDATGFHVVTRPQYRAVRRQPRRSQARRNRRADAGWLIPRSGGVL